jgi:Na+/melibiose symporter-like transporter
MRLPYDSRLVTLAVAFAALLAWLAFPVLNEFGSPRLKIVLIAAVGLVLMVVYLINVRRRLADDAAGRVHQDEFTHQASLNASHAAFMMSMVLWMVIFAVQDIFDSTRTMLGVGILGQCGFYGISLAFFKRTGDIHADQN